jgi:lipoprotein-releasing system ATP-binding protein
MSEPLIRAEGLVKSYASGSRKIDVLRGLDLEVASRDALAVVGESGVGKSTLLHLLGGLDRADAGRLLFRGEDMLAATAGSVARYRNRHVGFVFQMHYLLPEFTALENVCMPLRIGRRRGEIETEARDLLARLGLSDRRDHVPSALSGGEQQRVAIARALVSSPALVLADEPTGNLDPATGGAVFGLLREMQRERGFALIVATHSERLARGCDRVMRLEDGRLRPLEDAETAAYFDGSPPVQPSR